jgi:hypothetical protein
LFYLWAVEGYSAKSGDSKRPALLSFITPDLTRYFHQSVWAKIGIQAKTVAKRWGKKVAWGVEEGWRERFWPATGLN